MTDVKSKRQAYNSLPNVRERHLAYGRTYRKRDPAKNRARQAAWRKANPEADKKLRRRYRIKHLEQIKEYASKRRADFRKVLSDLKMKQGCIDCGYREHPAALDFDHINRTKVKEVSLCSSIKKALEEAEKCVVRCANCHRIRTFERRKAIQGIARLGR